jgi:hypothetical protein
MAATGGLVDEVAFDVERGKIREFALATFAADPISTDRQASAERDRSRRHAARRPSSLPRHERRFRHLQPLTRRVPTCGLSPLSNRVA